MGFPWHVSLSGYVLMGMVFLGTGGRAEAQMVSSTDLF